MRHPQTFRLAAGDEVFAGHFPGNPIAPGALVLDLAIRAVEQRGYSVRGVDRVKFLQVLRPEVDCSVELSERSATSLEITCRGQDGIILAAILSIADRRVPQDRDPIAGSR